MSVVRKKSPYDRRIRELQRETEQLQRSIKATSKSLAKSGVDPESFVPRPTRMAPPAEEIHSQPEPVPERQPAPPVPPESRAQPVPSNRYATPAAEKKPMVKDERFASYLATGSFGKSGPLSGERKLQRNRAVFMVVVVGLAVFLLYRFIF